MKKDTSVNVRLSSDLRAVLQRLAEADGRTLSGYISRLLELHVQDKESGARTGRGTRGRAEEK
jgi:predicted DNA binding CopG/RHH family protein